MIEWILFRGFTVAVLILANSFFVAAEFALVSVRETRLRQLIALARPGAETALALKRSIDDFLPAVQLGVTLASLALGWLGEPVVAEFLLMLLEKATWLNRIPGFEAHVLIYAHGGAIVIAFALITYFEVLLGELVPKALALQRAERIALAVAGPMDVFMRITRPAVNVMNTSARLVLTLFRAPLSGEGAVHSPEELKMIATGARRMGLLPPMQEQVIHRAIELNHVLVRDIMTPRGKIFALPADMPLEAASARIIEEQHSRIPIFDPKAGKEHIIGVVYSKDVSRLMHFRSRMRPYDAGGEIQLKLGQIMKDVLVVPETKPVADLIEELQQRKRQIAIVVDEFGTTVGLVTVEDAIEQLVGELDDEFDVANRAVLESGAGWILDGSVNLRDLETQMRWSLPREEGEQTVAGFLLTQLGHIPHVGESVEFDGRRFTILEMTRQKINRVGVEPVAQRDTAEARAS
ncbi:HlyC/CorC family transporter [Terriglobus albidus]|uniref:HlyC/CorC family transporter n=1 Tax=Terriglobus albidus TaxID=1592106 RepID=A0A5B9EC48_9BACT|nr:hemolysin family protein [Terriglobus albidus]QEE29214.1 HlyC/CorC family transporter [Terriglobus albidus]